MDAPPSSVAETLRWDQHRAGYIQRKLEDQVPITRSVITQVSHQGVVQPKVGTQGQGTGVQPAGEPVGDAPTGGSGGVAQTMVIDTASDVPWVQCAPCPAPHCHAQTDVLYDPSKSSSSAAFPCSSPACRNLGPYANGCTPAGDQCQYRVQYPDGSASAGTYISDVLTLNPAKPASAISEFRFGCSHALLQPGSFSNKTSGIMALGRGAQSLPTQTKATYGDVFSYCLPPTPVHSGFFILGVPRVAASRSYIFPLFPFRHRPRRNFFKHLSASETEIGNYVYAPPSSRYAVTPMLRSKAAPMLYLVRLIAIEVAGKRLPVPPAVFAAGAVMDSRTIVTRLPPTAYMALRAAFVAEMRAYRAAAPKEHLDTCYDFSGAAPGGGGGVKLPKITLVFDGPNGAVELDPSGVLLDGCLAFAPNTDDQMTGIIGNVQQQALEVLYNVDGATVGFRRGAC